ncbi:MAG: hypothetical protein OSA99_05795 [Acidimicrobiales bacterium]|nr:hypothetical protein [Acidimicrobiales bacterium]
MVNMRAVVAVLVAGGLTLGATSCGDEDGVDVSVDDPGSTRPSECPAAVPFDVEIRYDGDGARETMTVVDAVALRRFDGVAWTIYLADFDMPDDTSWSFTVPEVPPGNTLVATGLDVFNAPDADALPILEVGDSGGMFSDVGDGETAAFFSVTSDLAGSTSVDQAGTTELLHLEDGSICMTTEITGESGLELVGVYTATEIVDL